MTSAYHRTQGNNDLCSKSKIGGQNVRKMPPIDRSSSVSVSQVSRFKSFLAGPLIAEVIINDFIPLLIQDYVGHQLRYFQCIPSKSKEALAYRHVSFKYISDNTQASLTGNAQETKPPNQSHHH